MREREGPSIEAVDLVKVFRLGFRMRKVEALRGATFSAYPGEIFGFLGPNGAGKTTSIKVLVGLLRPTRGRCSILGRSPFDLEARRRIGYLPETPYFYDHLLPEEFMDLCGRLRGLSGQERRKRGGELLELVGLASSKDRPLRKFSKGMLQRIGLAQALIGDPEMLLLDEPMTGLDPIGRKEVRDLIVDLRKKGKTVFFSSHILADVEMICDRVAIVDRGRVVAQGALADLLSPEVRLVDIELSDVSPDLEEKIRRLADSVTSEGGLHHVTVRGEEASAELVRVAVDGSARIRAVVPKRETLEALFVRRALGMKEDESGPPPDSAPP